MNFSLKIHLCGISVFSALRLAWAGDRRGSPGRFAKSLRTWALWYDFDQPSQRAWTNPSYRLECSF